MKIQILHLDPPDDIAPVRDELDPAKMRCHTLYTLHVF